MKDLPGFQWDPERNRYFPRSSTALIQKNSNSDAFYKKYSFKRNPLSFADITSRKRSKLASNVSLFSLAENLKLSEGSFFEDEFLCVFSNNLQKIVYFLPVFAKCEDGFYSYNPSTIQESNVVFPDEKETIVSISNFSSGSFDSKVFIGENGSVYKSNAYYGSTILNKVSSVVTKNSVLTASSVCFDSENAEVLLSCSKTLFKISLSAQASQRPVVLAKNPHNHTILAVRSLAGNSRICLFSDNSGNIFLNDIRKKNSEHILNFKLKPLNTLNICSNLRSLFFSSSTDDVAMTDLRFPRASPVKIFPHVNVKDASWSENVFLRTAISFNEQDDSRFVCARNNNQIIAVFDCKSSSMEPILVHPDFSNESKRLKVSFAFPLSEQNLLNFNSMHVFAIKS